MSAVRCREGRLGKFTRPKDQWKGHRRGRHQDPLAGQMNTITRAVGARVGVPSGAGAFAAGMARFTQRRQGSK